MLWGAGVVLIVIGYTRARGPMTRYRRSRSRTPTSRYEAWRGGTRSGGDTGASVAMQILRRQARTGVIIGVVGFVLVVVGFLVR